MKKIKVNNIYGYPSLSPAIEAYAKKHGYKIMVGTRQLPELNSKVPVIVIAGFAMLLSFRIPLIGYKMTPNGIAYKATLPKSLRPNVVEVYLYDFSNKIPDHKTMLSFMRTGVLDESVPPRFKAGNLSTDLNKRIFNVPKPKKK